MEYFESQLNIAAFVRDFEYIPGETPLSSLQAPVVGIALYLLVWPLLKKWYGTVSGKDKKKLKRWLSDNPDKTKDIPDALKILQQKSEVAELRQQFYKPLLILHNTFLSIGSLIMLCGLLHGYSQQFALEAGYTAMFHRAVCDSGQTLFGRLQFWIWIFYLSKFYEFLDTVFLCVTMRPVILLHWIHHVLTLMVAWIGLETKHTVMGVACVMNTAIHVIMYAYWAYKQLYPDYNPWWKETLTNIQMRQFMVNLVGLAAWTYVNYTSEEQCTGEMWVIFVVLGVMVIFLGMFAAFSRRTYTNKDKTV